MLRNWSEVIPAGSPDAGALVSGTEFVGLLGSDIATQTGTGTHGSGIFSEWSLDPAKRYRALVTALTGGPLRLDENGAGEADASFAATLSVYEDNVLIASGVPLEGAIAPIHTAALALAEPADDQITVGATVNLPTEAALSLVEPADDTVLIGGEVYLQPQVLTVTVDLSLSEAADDIVAINGSVIGPAVGGMLAALAAEYATMRAASGLFVGSNEVLMCAINAARFYAGFAAMSDATARQGPFFVTGSTIVTTDEWAIIAPLFRLYVERESAVVVEASRVAGVEQVGRSYAEVAADIAVLEADMPNKAFDEEVFSVGFPVGL